MFRLISPTTSRVYRFCRANQRSDVKNLLVVAKVCSTLDRLILDRIAVFFAENAINT